MFPAAFRGQAIAGAGSRVIARGAKNKTKYDARTMPVLQCESGNGEFERRGDLRRRTIFQVEFTCKGSQEKSRGVGAAPFVAGGCVWRGVAPPCSIASGVREGADFLVEVFTNIAENPSVAMIASDPRSPKTNMRRSVLPAARMLRASVIPAGRRSNSLKNKGNRGRLRPGVVPEGNIVAGLMHSVRV